MAGIVTTVNIIKQAPSNGGKFVGSPEAYRALLRTIGLLKRAMVPYYARYGISASQWAVLLVLIDADGDEARGVRLTDLSDRLLIRPPSVTGAVDRLQRMGLVARKTSHADQRARIVNLTPSGRKLVERVKSGHASRVQRVLAALTLTQQRELQRLLNRLGDHLEVFANEDGDSDLNGESLRSRL
jgi:DNA-binding MarR family transcriptional regulator